MSSISWLHISDLHYGCEEGVSTRLFREEAADYLHEYFSQKQKPAFLFVTGDVVFPKGNPNIPLSYQKASVFINELSIRLGIDKHNVLIVPGNHDVSNDETSSRFIAAKKIREKGNYNTSFGRVKRELGNH